MSPPVSRRHPLWLLLAWGCYGLMAPWWVRTAAGWRDGPEFIVSSQALGIAHPAGFPLYSAWGWFLQQWLPLGDIAMRNHLSNTCLTLAAAVMLYELACAFFRFCDPDVAQAGAERHLAGFVSLMWLLLPPEWENAIQAEVYALFALFVFAILRLLLAYWQKGEERLYLIAVFLAGLGCGVHATVGFLIFAFVAFLAAGKEFGRTALLAAKALVAGCAGLAVYAYLPLRSRRDPVMDWGDTEHLAGFLRHITDQKDATTRFHHLLEHNTESQYNLLQLFWNMSDWLGPVLLLLAVAGWGVLLYRRFWPSLGMVLWLCFSFSFFAGWISGTVLTACLGVLLFGLVPWLGALLRRGRGIALVAILLFGGSGLVHATYAGVTFLAARSDRLPRAMAAEEMLALPYRATVLTGSSWFHVAALTQVEGMRPDVSAIPLGDLISPQAFKSLRYSDIPLLKPVPMRYAQNISPTAEELLDFLVRLRRANADRTHFFVDPDDGRNMRLFFPQLHPYRRLWLLWRPGTEAADCKAWQKTILQAMQPMFTEANGLRDWETSDFLAAPYFGHVTALIEQPPGCPRTAIGLIRWWQRWMQQDTVLQGGVFNDLGLAFTNMHEDRAARIMFQLGAGLKRPEAIGNLGLWYARHSDLERAQKLLAKAFILGLDDDYGRLRALSHRREDK